MSSGRSPAQEILMIRRFTAAALPFSMLAYSQTGCLGQMGFSGEITRANPQDADGNILGSVEGDGTLHLENCPLLQVPRR
jgi:hypothetical protein